MEETIPMTYTFYYLASFSLTFHNMYTVPRINLLLFCITLPHLPQFITASSGSSNRLYSRRYCTAISSLYITVLMNSTWLCIADGSLHQTVNNNLATNTTERHIPRFVYCNGHGCRETSRCHSRNNHWWLSTTNATDRVRVY